MAALVCFVGLMVGAAATVVVSAAPGPLRELAVVWGLTVATTVIGWALILVWKRITRKRRQYRNSG